MNEVATMSQHRYVLFSTFRKNGTAVGTAVWVAPFGSNQACFTTGGNSGKVKRLRNNSRITLQQCDVRGRVAVGSPIIEATARVVTGSECEPVDEAMLAKYKIQFKLLTMSNAITSRIKRRSVADAAIIIDFA